MKQIAILPVSLYVFLFCLSLSFKGSAQIISQPFDSNGTFTVPANVTSITVEAWGAGGSGKSVSFWDGADGGGGGGGGAYAKSTFNVAPGTQYSVVVGIGGSTTSGKISSFKISNTELVKAAGGLDASGLAGAEGGSVTNSTGQTRNAGGKGGNGIVSRYFGIATSSASGGGGGAAGESGNGGNATGKTGGAGRFPGGSGANGVDNNRDGADGIIYGGGGSGGARIGLSADVSGGSGANGLVTIKYICPITNAPTVGDITQPNCTLATGRVVLNGLPNGTWTLTRNDGVITTGSETTATIPGLIPGTYTYTVTTVTSCPSTVSADIVINERPNCWTGATDTNWNTASNWIHGVPTEGTDVSLNTIIPSGLSLSSYPIIYESAPSGYVNTMVLESGATITVRDNSLSIIQDLKLDGDIYLKGESQLLQDSNSTLDATSSGTIEINQQGTRDLYTYNYWSSPVVSNTLDTGYNVAGVLKDGTNDTARDITFINSGHDGTPGSPGTPIGIASYWIHKYSSSSNGYNGWQRIRSVGNLKVGEGFTMKGVENTNNHVDWEQNYVFVGKPNNGDITLYMEAGNDYLIGNPYPSALDADEFILDNIADGAGRAEDNIINGALYFWDHFGGGSHFLSDYQGGYATYTLIGGTEAISSDTRINYNGTLTSTKGKPQRYIPVSQGFFVSSILDESLIQDELVSPVVGGTITFKNSQRAFETESSGASLFMKPSNTKGKATAEKQVDTRQKIRLMFDSPKGYHRQLLVGADARASNGFDLGFDAPLIETNQEDMFWVFKNNEFVIQAVNNFDEDQILPLGIKIKQAGISKVKIDDLENMPNNAKIYLNDKELGIFHPITDSPYEVYLEAGDYLDRFEITFKSSGTLDVDDVIAQENIQVYFSNQLESIIVHNPVLRQIKSVELVNLLGQSIQKFNGTTQNYVEYKTNQMSAGVYIIKVQTVEGSVSKKVLIK